MDNNSKEYTKLDVLAIDKDIYNLAEWLKKGIPQDKMKEYYKYATKMYLDIDTIEHSVKVTLPTYSKEQFQVYIEGLVHSATAVGFEIYVKEIPCQEKEQSIEKSP